MITPLDLYALKAKALAVVADGWYEDLDIGKVLDVNTRADGRFIVAANPSVMLELLARLERAEAQASQHVRGATPAPVYDPSLNVPAEIIEAANTVSTWAAKQNRGSWRIGNVCSPDFGGNQEDLARLRSNIAILSAQSEALHLVAHAIGLPAGEDVTKAVLPAVKLLATAIKHEHTCHRDGDITFTMSMRVGDKLFRVGRDLNGVLLDGSIDEMPVIAVTAQGLYRQLKAEVADLTTLIACATPMTPERAQAILDAREKRQAGSAAEGGAQ